MFILLNPIISFLGIKKYSQNIRNNLMKIKISIKKNLYMRVVISIVFSLAVLGVEFRTSARALAKQVLYHFSHSTSSSIISYN
jgi:hypothetical protein